MLPMHSVLCSLQSVCISALAQQVCLFCKSAIGHAGQL